jgi:putative addiction module component (TIGR02574 family)
MASLRAMSTAVQQLTVRALALPDSERLAVANALWKSLKPGAIIPDEETGDLISMARAQELSKGTVKPLRHEDVFKRARKALG